MDIRRITMPAVIAVVALLALNPVTCFSEPQKPCAAIKDYVLRVPEIANYRFGDERQKELLAAQSKLQGELQQSNYKMSEELSSLLARYVNATTLGYDRMRRGDATLLTKARELEDQIKKICPWD